MLFVKSLHWHHNGCDSVSNHQPHDCLFSRLFRRRSKETSKFRVTGLCVGNSPGTGEFPQKWPVTRKMFPFDEVIMDSFHFRIDIRGLWYVVDRPTHKQLRCYVAKTTFAKSIPALLTNPGVNKMAKMLKTTLSNILLWLKWWPKFG